MDITTLLLNLGLNISSGVLSNIISSYFSHTDSPTRNGLKKLLVNELHIEGADIKSEKIIDFLAENGLIEIKDTHIFASRKIEFASTTGSSFIFGEDSVSETNGTKMETKGNARIVGKGNVKIVQDDEDGSIRFYA